MKLFEIPEPDASAVDPAKYALTLCGAVALYVLFSLLFFLPLKYAFAVPLETAGWIAGIAAQFPASGLLIWVFQKENRLVFPAEKTFFAAVRSAVAGFLIVMICGQLLTALWGKLLRMAGFADLPQTQKLVDFALTLSPGGLLFLTLVLVLAVPVTEELFFRFFTCRLTAHFLGGKAAFWVTAAVFGAVHGFVLGFPMLFLLGLVLQGVYFRTRTLWAPVMLHAAVNLSAILGIALSRCCLTGE